MEPSTGRGAAANQSSLRDHNLRVVTRALWGAGGGLSRAGLATSTGLTRATVSRLVAQLLEAGMVIEGGPTDSGLPGRPGTPLFASAGRVAALGLDVNVDHFSGRVIDLAGEVLDEFVVPREVGADPQMLFGQLGRRARQLIGEVVRTRPGLELCGICLAVPGLVSDSSLVRVAPNLGWRNVHPFELMGPEFAALDVPLVVENDANLQALAASRIAPGHLIDEPTFLYIGGDIGVGSALIEDGWLRRGLHGWAGELGHLTVDPRGPECACGSRGCLERYAGRRAMYEAAGLEARFDSDLLVQQIEAGNPAALHSLDRAAEALGVAIGSALNLLDMRQVILGTSLAVISEWLIPRVDAELAKHLLWTDFESVAVLAASADRLPSATGGAYQMLELVLDDPAGWIERTTSADED